LLIVDWRLLIEAGNTLMEAPKRQSTINNQQRFNNQRS